MSIYRQAAKGEPIELYTESSCVFVFGALFFGGCALFILLLADDAIGYGIAAALLVLVTGLVVMSRRTVTIDVARRTVWRANGIGKLKLYQQRFPIGHDDQVLFVTVKSTAPGPCAIRLRGAEGTIPLIAPRDEDEANELAVTIADELGLELVDREERWEGSGRQMRVADFTESVRLLA